MTANVNGSASERDSYPANTADLTHGELLNQVQEGSVFLGVRPAEARRFYTDLTQEQVHDLSGKRQNARCLLVRAILATEGVMFLATLLLTGFAFGWHALWIAPVVAGAYMASKASASMGRPGVIWPTGLASLGAVSAVWFHNSGRPLALSGWCVAISTLPILSRLVYRTAASFVRSLVLSSPAAFYRLRDKLLIVMTVDDYQGADRPLR